MTRTWWFEYLGVYSGRILTSCTILRSSIALGDDTASTLCENPVHPASISPGTGSTKGHIWKAELVPITQKSTYESHTNYAHNATTTANCYLSTFNRNTQWIKRKVEDISQDPGTIPDVDLSSHRIRLLVLTTWESQGAQDSWRMCGLIN